MELIKKFPETMNDRAVYKLMKSPDVKKMSEAVDSILDVAAWINYEDTDEKTGEVKSVLVVATKDGEMFGTISNTFMREFADITKFFGDDVGEIKVIGGKSRAGRSYITCTVE